jgi:multidrug efflux pump
MWMPWATIPFLQGSPEVNFSYPFIRRPVGTTLLAIGMFLVGCVAYSFLPVASLPSFELPTVRVTASRPGADPAIMAATVAAPLERRLGEIAGVSEITSVSSLGSSSITIQFDLGRSIDGAGRDVQAALNAAATDLPGDLPTLPTFRKVNPAAFPIFIVALTSPTIPAAEIYNIADTVVVQRLSQVEGVAEVTATGAEQPAVRVQFNPVALAAIGLSAEDVRNAIVNANAAGPVGVFDGPGQAVTLGSNGQLWDPRDFNPVVLKSANGTVVRLTDVASVRRGTRNNFSAAWFNRQPAVLLTVTRQSNSNIIETVDHIKDVLDDLKNWIPADVHISILSDRSQTIRASVRDMQITLGITAVLVMFVVLVFLRRATPTIAAGITVPLSLAGTCALMWLAGFSIDNLSLMALAVSVGFVVDDAIVMIENVFRNLEAGSSPLRATIEGAKQIGFTVVSISISLVAAFIPLLFMGGIIGRVFREFSVTLAFAILVSTIVSLTVTPMICAHFVRTPPSPDATRFDRLVEGVLRWMIRGYDRSLAVVLRHRALTLLVWVATIALTANLYYKVPKSDFPEDDTGLIFGSTQAATDVSYGTMRELQLKAADIVMADPAVAGIGSFIGTAGNFTVNQGRIFISLKPLSERKLTTGLVVERLRNKLKAIPGFDVFMVPTRDVRVGGRSSRSQYQFTLWSPEVEDLQHWTPLVLQRVRAIADDAGLTDITTDREQGGLQADVVIDRAAAARLCVAVQDIDNALNDAFAQRQISTYYTQRNQYRVVLEIDPTFQRDPTDLSRVYVQASAAPRPSASATTTAAGGTLAPGCAGNPVSAAPTSGSLTSGNASSPNNNTGVVSGAALNQVPLSAVAHFRKSSAPLVVNHQGQFPAVTITYNLKAGVGIEEASAKLVQAVNDLHMPDTIHAEFAGDVKAFAATVNAQPWLILAALIAVYIVLGVLYESLAHPLTIISTLPSAGLGALLALLVSGTELTVIAFIGIILLIGIVKKNGIMMVDFALDGERERGLSPERAIHEACLERFRPILMTTMAALLGAVPLMLAVGPGAELRRPLGITIIGGLVVSQALTLYTTPVIYLLLDRLHRRLGGAAGQHSFAAKAGRRAHRERSFALRGVAGGGGGG